MKRIQKSPEPKGLKEFREAYPKADWESFKNEAQTAYQELKSVLVTDQHNLCAYCEKELLPDLDQMVEHYHPKSDKTKNWDLEWSNLLMCCLGGRATNSDRLRQEGRVALEPVSENLHCDIKGDDIIDSIALNPLDVPESPLIWNYQTFDGSLSVNVEACKKAGVDPDRAEQTLCVFNLNSPTLRLNRRTLYNQIRKRLTKGRGRTQTINHLVGRFLKTRNDGTKHCYFTTARSALGKKAESYLQQSGDF